ncbi:hypothetical protein LTR53_011402 [Teratosphaeriaceae sp. CCFEE 6253]|nr:hypothetical protein LTR53_011402 [Teratosphaeriaceae sp. CCFEE 6253]
MVLKHKKPYNKTAGSVANSESQSVNTPTPTQTAFPTERVALPLAPAASTRLTTSQSALPGANGGKIKLKLGLPPPPAVPKLGNVWNKKATASLFKDVLTRQGLTVAASMRQGPAASPSEVASQLGGLRIDPSPKAVANPSEGPGATEMGGGGKVRAAPTTRYSTMSTTQRIGSMFAKSPRWRRRDFCKGDIISLPFHTANSNPNVDPNDERLTETVEGYVYSKRRMLAVLWIYGDAMFCLPMFSFGSRGIQSKPERLRHEYVALRNVKDRRFVNQGVHAPVDATHSNKPFTPETAIHITGGVKVGCNEDIAFCGRLTETGYMDLLELYKAQSEAAQGEMWRK